MFGTVVLKRALPLLLALAFLLAPAALAGETEELASVEAFEAELLAQQTQASSGFELSCTQELFATLKENNFAELYRIAYRCGMTDFGLRYSSSGALLFENVAFQSPISYADCATIDDVEAAVFSCLQEGLDYITLMCSDDVFQQVFKNADIYRIMARAGVGDFDVAGNANACLISNMTAMTVPNACVGSVSEAGERISAWREAGETAFNLVFDQNTYANLTRDDYRLIAFLGGLSDYSLSYSNNACMLIFSEAVYSDIPGVYCTAESQIVDAIRAMGAQGIATFQIKMDEETYQAVQANSFARLYELEAQAGMTDGSLSYSGSNALVQIENAVIAADATQLKTLGEVIDHVNACVERGDENISLLMTQEVYSELMDGVYSLLASHAKLYDLIANAGICTADSFSFNRETGSISLYGVQYYPGENILRAVNNGDTSVLTDREQEALAAAQQMAEACQRETQPQTALAIHDALCQQITYLSDDILDEGDGCIGALLNGQADCDGYADAMFLVGRLAGLNVRRQYGDSANGGVSGWFTTHMWNLIELDGSWRMMDVTWDDTEGMSCHLWFNIGADRASQTHAWNADMSVELLPETDVAGRPAAEYFASTEDEVAEAAAAAQAANETEFDIFVSGDSGLTEITAPLALQRGISGEAYYYWIPPMRCLHVMLAQ